jgi:hypothetical protein
LPTTLAPVFADGKGVVGRNFEIQLKWGLAQRGVKHRDKRSLKLKFTQFVEAYFVKK